MFDLVPTAGMARLLQAEACAARGARLPAEAEFQRAACGSPVGERIIR
jgi:hypothetical protein